MSESEEFAKLSVINCLEKEYYSFITKPFSFANKFISPRSHLFVLQQISDGLFYCLKLFKYQLQCFIFSIYWQFTFCLILFCFNQRIFTSFHFHSFRRNKTKQNKKNEKLIWILLFQIILST